MKTIKLDSKRRDFRDQISGGITRSGQTATFTSTDVHRLSTGDKVTISGAAQAEYNGVFEVTVSSTTVFTFTVTGSPVTPATGSPVLRKNPNINEYADPENVIDPDGRQVVTSAAGIVSAVSVLKTHGTINVPTRLHSTEGVHFVNRVTFWGTKSFDGTTGKPTDNTGDVYIGLEQFKLPIKVEAGKSQGIEFPHGIVDLYNMWMTVETANDGVYVAGL